MTRPTAEDALQAPPLVRGYVKGLRHDERLRMMHGELYRGVQAFHDPNRYKELLRFISSQPKRSPNNQLLIWLQHPSTTIALGPKDWQKKHGQRVRQDAWHDPIWIFAPVTMLPANVNRSTMAAQSRGSVKVLVQPLKLSLLAIATELVSCLSVNTWNSSSAPRRSSSM
jgi:hypothetical protein